MNKLIDTKKQERFLFPIMLLMATGSGVMTAICAHLYLSEQGLGTFLAILLSILIGMMVSGGMIAFKVAAMSILPRLGEGYQGPIIVSLLSAITIFISISGLSNSTTIGYAEGKRLHNETSIGKAEESFGIGQSNIRKIAQLDLLLEQGAQMAQVRKKRELRGGSTGSGKGVIYTEIEAKETLFVTARKTIEESLTTSRQSIRDGQKILAKIRNDLKDQALSNMDQQERLRIGLDRMSTVIINLHNAMPLTSLSTTAELLERAPTTGALSHDPDKRKDQIEELQKLHSDFAPIGHSLAEGVTEVTDAPIELPRFERLSPIGTILRYADSLIWTIFVGFGVDLLIFLALGILFMAHHHNQKLERKASTNRDQSKASRGRKNV